MRRRMFSSTVFVCVWIVTLFSTSVVEAVTLYIAPGGHDSWSGTLGKPNANRTDGPLASLVTARNVLRAIRKQTPLSESVHVMIADGEYPLTEPVVFEPQDSGTETCPIIYQAAPGARPVFTGGKVITGFKPGPNNVWTTHIPEVATNQWYFEQLFVDGRRAIRARSPNKFYYHTNRPVTSGVDPLTGKPATLDRRAFLAHAGNIKPWANLNDIILTAYHSWAVSRLRLAFVDPKTGMVVTTGPARWPFMHWQTNQRYHLENAKAFLDAPGEWHLARDGTLSYLPLPSQDMTKARVIAPRTEQFIHFKGDASEGQFVEHIMLKGLSFQHSQYITPHEGYASPQAASNIPATIMADDARNIRIENCEIAHTGIYGIWFRKGCSHCRIQQCYLYDLGAGGIRIGPRSIPPKESAQTKQITVDNNILYTGGQIFLGAVGIWIGHSHHNTITHNDISNFYYTGISAGWQWGYTDSLAHHNTIAYNHIHHIGKGVLSDMGGVYTLGPSPGTIIHHNKIHDVYSYDYGGWGLYNDEGSSGIVLENNLVYNVKTGGYHQHYGRNNLVRNNVFAFSQEGQLQRTKSEEHLAFTFENNIVYWNQGWLLTAEWQDLNFLLRSNLYFNASGKPVTFGKRTWDQWQAAGQDKGSINADPLFVDADNFDFRLKPESPAQKIGFKPFDTTQAGVYGPKHWITRAAQQPQPPLEVAPKPPTSDP